MFSPDEIETPSPLWVTELNIVGKVNLEEDPQFFVYTDSCT